MTQITMRLWSLIQGTDILSVKSSEPLEALLTIKLGGDIPAELYLNLKDDAIKV